MQYQVQLKQLVSYSRCRIYRNFLHTIAGDASIRVNGSSYLFYFMMLCSLANYRTSTLCVDGLSYTLEPGEWMMPVRELAILMRKKTDKSTLELLEVLQSQHYIQFIIAHKGKYVKFKIADWEKFNTAIEATAPCQKDDGFFFFPYRLLAEFIGRGKCAEMDMLLDLWLNAIYNDERIIGSDVGPVVYFRNGTHSPLTSYDALSQRWCVSKSTVGRILRKFEENGLTKLVAFPGKIGSAIYLCNYLSTMFNISDVTIDKEEVAMALNLKVNVQDTPACQNEENTVSAEQICVPESDSCVPKSHMIAIVQKTAKVLGIQGIACASCAHARYTLSHLSDCKRKPILSELLIRCPHGGGAYRFRLEISPHPDEVAPIESEVI